MELRNTVPPYALGIPESRQPDGMVLADESELKHNNSYDGLPAYYLDKSFVCVDCGSDEVWTAKQQKWWYEIAKGNINSTAVRSRPFRKIKQGIKAEARRVQLEGAARKNKDG